MARDLRDRQLAFDSRPLRHEPIVPLVRRRPRFFPEPGQWGPCGWLPLLILVELSTLVWQIWGRRP